MKVWIVSALAAGLCLLALDAVWLWNSAERLYRPSIGELLAPQFRLAPAVAFYLIYVAGLVYFAVMPALSDNSVWTAVIKGALLGIVAYGTYDLTNQATMKVWPTSLTIIDIGWGALLSAISASVGFLAGRSAANF